MFSKFLHSSSICIQQRNYESRPHNSNVNVHNDAKIIFTKVHEDIGVEDKIVLTQCQAITIFDLTCYKIGRTLFYVYTCYNSIEKY